MSESPPHAVFLSYASQDAEAAKRICEALRTAGIEVWFDQSELVGGDAWDAKIRGQIKACALFVPVISANTQSRREGYFRREWKQATERTRDIADGTPFLLPVVIDATRDTEALVPEEFRAVQWTRLPGGETPAAFCERVKNLIGGSEVARAFQPVGSTDDTGSKARATPTKRRSSFALSAAAFAIVAAIGTALFVSKKSEPPSAPPKPVTETKAAPAAPLTPVVNDKSIAVLPFDNMSEDKDANAFFSDGVHEDILTNLTHIRELRVISRPSVMEYRGKTGNIREIARKLGVTYILVGSVRRAANKVRVTGSLIRAATDEQLWAEDYTKDLTTTDIFAIQSELAQKIAGSLQTVLSPQEKKSLGQRATENLQAYDLYLQARAEGQNLGVAALRLKKQESLLEAAVALDPKFALAWAELAVVRIDRYNNYSDRSPALLDQAKKTIDTAGRLAPEAPEVGSALGRYYLVNGDYPHATEQFQERIRRQPNDASGYFELAVVQRRQGQWTASLENFRKSAQLDPGDFNRIQSGGTRLVDGGRRYDESLAWHRRLAELHPDNPGTAYDLAYVHFKVSGSTREVEEFFAGLKRPQDGGAQRRNWAIMQGNLAEAIRLERQFTPNDETRSSVSALRFAIMLAASGDLTAARTLLEKHPAKLRSQLETEPANVILLDQLAQIEAILGHSEAALRYAQKSMELMPQSFNPWDAPSRRFALAFVYAWTGDKNRAVAEYAQLLRMPSSNRHNAYEMKHHPDYAPLQGYAPFEALLNDPKNNAPLF